MSNLNYDAFGQSVRSRMSEAELTGLIGSTMTPRANKYSTLGKKCSNLIRTTNDYIKTAFLNEKENVSRGYIDGGPNLDGILSTFDNAAGDIDEFIAKLKEYEEMYSDASTFYSELAAEASAKIAEANAKIQAMEAQRKAEAAAAAAEAAARGQETTTTDYAKESIEAFYTIQGRTVTYEIKEGILL